MHPRVVGGAVTVRRADFAGDLALAKPHRDDRPIRVAMVLIDEAQRDPVAAIGHDVVQHIRRAIAVDHDDVDAAVVVDVAERRGPAGVSKRFGGPAARLDLAEFPIHPAAKQQVRLSVRIVRVALVLPHHPAVGFIQIEKPIVVKILPTQAKAGEAAADRRQTRCRGAVLEISTTVSIQRIGFGAEISDQQIQIAIVIEVFGGDAHARLGHALQIRSASIGQGHVFKMCAVIEPELVVHAVVGDEDVDAVIAIEIAAHHAQAGAETGVNLHRVGDVGEGSVAVVAIQGVGKRRLIVGGAAIVVAAEVRAIQFGRRRPGQIIADVQIQIAIAVVIEESGARSPTRVVNTGHVREIDEMAGALVSQQNVPPDAGDVQIDIAIVVVIARGHPHAVAADIGAAAGGNVLERAVAAIAEQLTGGRREISLRFQMTAGLHQKEVQIAVVVHVEQRRAAAHDLRHEIALAMSGLVHEVHAALQGLFGKPWNASAGIAWVRWLC